MAVKTIKRIMIPIVVLALGAAGFALLVNTKPKSQAAPRQESVWTVAVQSVEPRPLRPMLTLYGRVETPRRSRLKAAIEASVSRVPVREGQRVEEWQPLVILDDRESAALLAQREADVRDAEAALASELSRYQNDLTALGREKELLRLALAETQRAEDLVRRNLGSESQRDAAQQSLVRQRLAVESRQLSIADHTNRLAQMQARLVRAQAQRDIADLDHQHSRIVAPFTGRIARVSVAPGDRVRPGDTAVELYDLSGLEARAQIPETQLSVIRTALENGEDLVAQSHIDGRTIDLRLDRLAGEVSRGSGGVDALFQLRQDADWLAVGRFITLRLALSPQPDVVALPREALYGRDRVYRVVQDRLQPLTVERVGSRINPNGAEEVLVRSPALNKGDRLVTTQLPNAVEGLRVRIAEDVS